MSAKIKVGDLVTWTHFYADGRSVERTGTVWALAPLGNGLTSPLWVLEEDSTEPIAVAVGRKDGRTVAKGSPFANDYFVRIEAGALYSEEHAGTPTGTLTASARNTARRFREENERKVAA